MMKSEPIARAWEEAKAVWPGVEVSLEDFAAFVQAVPGPHVEGKTTRWADLYLACACAQSRPGALAAFEKAFFREVDAAAAGIRGGVSADELRQLVRHKLLLSQPGQKPRIAEYAGRGDLRTWLRIAATRIALDLSERAAREVPKEDDELVLMMGGSEDPELSYFRRQYTEEFRNALRDAFASLDHRDRSLLRYAFTDRLSIDSIGALFGVHRATAARWLCNAHARVASQAKQALGERLGINREELSSVLRLIQSQFDVTLDRYLLSANVPASPP